MRALNAYVQLTDSRKARVAVERAGELFLERKLFRRKTTGEVINPMFTMMHYPYFWQYTFLHGLRVMAEASLILDPRCGEALDLLESKRLPDGGFPAERRHYSVTRSRDKGRRQSAQTLVDWGPTSAHNRSPGKRSNDFITAEALTVLKAAGRLVP
jgi:hypothetical protein